MASSQPTKQRSLDLYLSIKKTRKQELLAQMENVVPWAALVELIAPYYPEGKNGRPPFALETMLRIHCMQQWFALSDVGMQEAFFDTPVYREFAQLKAGTAVDATLIAAPSSTKNKDKKRDPEMHSSQKGNEWQRMALWHERQHRSGCKLGTGAQRHWHLRHRVRRD